VRRNDSNLHCFCHADDVGVQTLESIQDPIDQGMGWKFIVIQAQYPLGVGMIRDQANDRLDPRKLRNHLGVLDMFAFEQLLSSVCGRTIEQNQGSDRQLSVSMENLSEPPGTVLGCNHDPYPFAEKPARFPTPGSA